MTPNEDLPHRYNFWPLATSWIIICVLIGAIWFVCAKTQISCHYVGDLMTPAAKIAKSEEGIALDDVPEKKTPPLAPKTPAYGPAK